MFSLTVSSTLMKTPSLIVTNQVLKKEYICLEWLILNDCYILPVTTFLLQYHLSVTMSRFPGSSRWLFTVSPFMTQLRPIYHVLNRRKLCWEFFNVSFMILNFFLAHYPLFYVSHKCTTFIRVLVLKVLFITHLNPFTGGRGA